MAFTRPRAAQINFDVTNIADPLIKINSGQSGSADKDAGIILERGSDTNVGIIFDESQDEFACIITTEDGSTSGNVVIGSYANVRANIFQGVASSAQYADVAEKYTSDKNYDPGTVLVFDGEQETTQSKTQIDKKIAGVVSTNPAYLMNNKLVTEDNVVEVALLGRVPCKVVGAIKKGDLLVSSDIPGHAMAWKDESNPPTGSVIGKSLEIKKTRGESIIEIAVGLK